MNREKLLRVADVIAPLPYAEKLDGWGKPKSFNMSTGFGSACCVAGWTAEIFKGEYVTLKQGREILELNSVQADALFKPPGYGCMEVDGRTGAQVLRLTAAAGDDVTGAQIQAFWRNPWA